MFLAPVDRGTLAHRTAAAIAEAVASGRLPAGQRLVETRLAAELHVSRGPLRDACRLLASEGLLTIIPHRGTYVARLTLEDLRNVLDLRAGLEARAARLIIERAGSDAIAKLRNAVAELRVACETGDSTKVSLADYRFHETLCRITGNEPLHSVFVKYSTEVRVLLKSEQERLYAGTDISSAHAALVDLLEHRDPQLAEDAFRRHVEGTRDGIINGITSRLSGSRNEPGAA